MTTKLDGGGGGVKALVVGPLKKHIFLRFPLASAFDRLSACEANRSCLTFSFLDQPTGEDAQNSCLPLKHRNKTPCKDNVKTNLGNFLTSRYDPSPFSWWVNHKTADPDLT